MRSRPITLSPEIQLTLLLACLFFIYEGKMFEALNTLIILLFCNNLMDSFLQQSTTLFATPEAVMSVSLKKTVNVINDDFNCIATNYIISSLEAGYWTPYQHFSSLNQQPYKKLLDVLTTKRPYNLHLTFGKNLFHHQKAHIDSIVQTNTIHHAAWSCITFQQGFRDENNLIATLPQEILNIIYAFTFPSNRPYLLNHRKSFVNKVNRFSPGFFNSGLTTPTPDEQSDTVLARLGK